jgi:hypothetical protein
MGAKIPGMDTNTGTNTGTQAGSPQAATPMSYANTPILNAVNNGVGTAPQQPQWGVDTNTNIVANPNNNYMPTATGQSNNIGFNPNTDMSAGVPTYNTPSTNQQGAPSFSFNQAYQTPPNPTNIMASIMTPSQYSATGR